MIKYHDINTTTINQRDILLNNRLHIYI